MTGGLFDDAQLEELTVERELPPIDEDPRVDALIAARREVERARNVRRRGTRRSHPCPACGRRTFRAPKVDRRRGVVDDRCQGCAEGNPLTGVAEAWAEQNTDRAGVDAGLDDRPRCPVHRTQLAPCGICASLLAGPE